MPRLARCGACGIASQTSRHDDRARQYFLVSRIADEIVRFGVEGPICLCHGALGQMEFLAAAVERGVPNDLNAAATWRRRLLARLLSGDWVADEAHLLESPGLMLGLAGTGYALLRASYPQRIPSVLTVEPLPAKRFGPLDAIERSEISGHIPENAANCNPWRSVRKSVVCPQRVDFVAEVVREGRVGCAENFLRPRRGHRFAPA